MDSNSPDINELKLKRRKYLKINMWSCLGAFIVASGNAVFNLVFEFCKVDTKIAIPIAITMLIISLLCIIPLIISWAKLRKIERTLKQNGIEDIEEE